MLRLTVLAILLLPAAGVAGTVAVCDGFVSTGPSGEALCSVAWRYVQEGYSASFPWSQLSVDDGVQVWSAIALLWAIAFVWRLLIRFVDRFFADSSPPSE